MSKMEKKEKNRIYPVIPYVIGLFIMVIALVVLSYLMQLRNKQEIIDIEDNQNYAGIYDSIDKEN